MNIDQIFCPIIGKYIWGVQRSHGTYLKMEFGSPHLAVREPRSTTSKTDSIRRLWRRRQIVLAGEYRMTVLDCRWEISAFSETAKDTDKDDREWKNIFESISGQKLLSVEAGKTEFSYIFKFDLGGICVLEPNTFEASGEVVTQWEVSLPDGAVVSYQNDGLFTVD